jgi:hypothetical protein
LLFIVALSPVSDFLIATPGFGIQAQDIYTHSGPVALSIGFDLAKNW